MGKVRATPHQVQRSPLIYVIS